MKTQDLLIVGGLGAAAYFLTKKSPVETAAAHATAAVTAPDATTAQAHADAAATAAVEAQTKADTTASYSYFGEDDGTSAYQGGNTGDESDDGGGSSDTQDTSDADAKAQADKDQADADEAKRLADVAQAAADKKLADEKAAADAQAASDQFNRDADAKLEHDHQVQQAQQAASDAQGDAEAAQQDLAEVRGMQDPVSMRDAVLHAAQMAKQADDSAQSVAGFRATKANTDAAVFAGQAVSWASKAADYAAQAQAVLDAARQGPSAGDVSRRAPHRDETGGGILNLEEGRARTDPTAGTGTYQAPTTFTQVMTMVPNTQTGLVTPHGLKGLLGLLGPVVPIADHMAAFIDNPPPQMADPGVPSGRNQRSNIVDIGAYKSALAQTQRVLAASGVPGKTGRDLVAVANSSVDDKLSGLSRSLRGLGLPTCETLGDAHDVVRHRRMRLDGLGGFFDGGDSGFASGSSASLFDAGGQPSLNMDQQTVAETNYNVTGEIPHFQLTDPTATDPLWGGTPPPAEGSSGGRTDWGALIGSAGTATTSLVAAAAGQKAATAATAAGATPAQAQAAGAAAAKAATEGGIPTAVYAIGGIAVFALIAIVALK